MHSFDDDILFKSAKHAPADERSAPAETNAAARDVRSAAGLLHLQRRIGNAGVAQLMSGEHADDDKRSVEEATRSGGQPLDSATRVQMEGAIGADFSSVRVHTGGDADRSAAQLGAHAYTVGDDVVFASGRYEPESPTGQRTLAHELTHVVQQRSGPVEGTDTGGGVRVSHPSDRYEQAAENMADQVVASRAADASAVSTVSADAGRSVQRDGADEEQEDVQALAVQREQPEAEEDQEEVQALAVQRAGEEDQEEVQTLAVQREGEEEDQEEVQTLAVQREGEEEDQEDVQALAVQREGEEEDEQGTG